MIHRICPGQAILPHSSHTARGSSCTTAVNTAVYTYIQQKKECDTGFVFSFLVSFLPFLEQRPAPWARTCQTRGMEFLNICIYISAV